MITVAHVITALGSGGAERVLYLVASADGAGIDIKHVVVSLTDEGIYGAELRKAGVRVECLGMRRGRLSIGAYLRLVRLLRRIRPDVVMTWLYHADLLGTLAARSLGLRRIIWNIRCSELDFGAYSPLTRWTVAALARLSAAPWGVAANSHAGRRAHETLGYKPKRWIYLPNGFDTEQWRPDAVDRQQVRRELGLSPADFVIGLVARVDPQKDHDNFLVAARIVVHKHPRVRLLLIGEGTRGLDIPQELRPFTIALGERRDVPRLLRSLDIHVSNSAYGEGCPNAVGEAMASGVPCVATDVGDAAFMVGDDGVVVPPRRPDALAAAIESLLHLPEAELRVLGDRGRQRIERAFSMASCLRAYANLVREVAAGDWRAP